MTGAQGAGLGTPSSPAERPWLEVDLLVVGSGAAGLAAAVTAASKGLRVAVFEKHTHFGGTSAWSGGAMWIPGGLTSTPDTAATEYIEGHLGTAYAQQKLLVLAYLKHGPRMVKHFLGLEQGALRFEADKETPDFFGNTVGRVLRVPAFNARQHRHVVSRMRSTLPEFTFLGVAVETGKELNHFLNMLRWPLRGSISYVRRRFKSYAWDLVRHRRTMHLVNGNALVASLLSAVMKLGVRLHSAQPVLSLIEEGGRVCGAHVDTPEGTRKVSAIHGVVLACGGFPHDNLRIPEWYAHAPNGHEHWSAAPAQNTGDGVRLGESVGGHVLPTHAAPAAWAPVSLTRRSDGSTAVYPHFIDRAKPGVIAVNRAGDRFCNEAGSYHDFVLKWIETSPSNGPLEAWLICDRRFLRRYGLGAAGPGLFSFLQWLRPAYRSGYLKAGRTIESLAKACGIESRGLQETVAQYNQSVPDDPRFRRGTTAFEMSQGDDKVRPNPCVASICRPPYFAVRLYPGSLGTLAGLQTNARAQVLGPDQEWIKGLYACGNDMAAVMGGFYPANGVTLGSAMTFGYVAARQATAEKLRQQRAQRRT